MAAYGWVVADEGEGCFGGGCWGVELEGEEGWVVEGSDYEVHCCLRIGSVNVNAFRSPNQR